MVKFAKQLEVSLVPEWKDRYCNYKALKRDVKKVQEDRSRRNPDDNAESLARSGTLTRTMTRTMTHISTFKHNVENQLRIPGASGRMSLSRARSGTEPLVPDDFLVVHRLEADCYGDPQFEQFETELLDPLQPHEADRQFFKRLDAQLNKVNQFYKMKETQYLARAKRLEQQLVTLFQVQEEHARQKQMFEPKVKNRDSDDSDDDDDDDDEDDGDDGDDNGFSASFKQGNESPLLHNIVTVKSGEHLSRVNEAVAEDEEPTTSEDGEERTRPTSDNSVSFDGEAKGAERPEDEPAVSKSNSQKSRGTELQARRTGSHHLPTAGGESPFRSVLNKGECRSRLQPDVKITVDKDDEDEDDEAQRSKLINILKEQKTAIQDMIDLSLQKKKLVTSEKMLCKAFVEFYRGLNLLKSYSSLNLVAFAKITKKYDKAVKLRLGPVYLKEVERSYFATSNKINKVMVRVEDIFTKSFSSHDRRKAMAKLRPQRQHSGHMITFFLGIFSGLSMLLLAIFIVMLRVSPAVRARGDVRYMTTVFYVFSSLGLVLLHLYLYGWNLYAWQQTRINYAFIFEHRPGTELRYRQVLCVSSGFTTLLLATMNIHLYISTNEAPTFRASEYFPLACVLVFLIALFLPVNTLYKSARAFFLRCLRHLILAPFYKVVMADFFLGDQLTSQVLLFRNIEFMLCYYTNGFFLDRVNGGCGTKHPFRGLVYFFCMLPYWFRFLQCLRRYRDDHDHVQLWNAGKYASALLAVLIKTRYVERGTRIWLALFIIFSIIAVLYQLYWDLVIDWGLLQRHSQNPWLRDQLILKKKYLYFISMVVNGVLRIAWLSSIQGFNFIPGLSRPGWEGMFGALEVIRRGHWNFYRLENEHLNNVGKYRAVKSVPLPFDDNGHGAFL